MSDDYNVDGLGSTQVRGLAKRARSYLNLSDADFVDLIALEAVDQIWTMLGPKPFRLETVSDAELPDDSGLTTFDGVRILTRIRRSIRHDALLGHGYPRFTIAHELGHATLHARHLLQGASMPRRQQGNARLSWIPNFQSAERQAMTFAAAFLINDETARSLSSADEVAIRFGLSLEAARIYYEQMLEEIERPLSAERVRRMADEFKAIVGPTNSDSRTISFLNDPCLSCGQKELFPVNGSRYMCRACDRVYDRYQDGDQAG
ncbi:ImmA/IrrE family metallo-endopeptidase [Bradyrhizobium sp. SSUT77]|uniref:ImmA/IrrE family metallo-endopeptidase n=1 Tax=Bradyrhizobium sp. SSUT77 TaxID=3040603 RepID=UPI002448EC78|nr:ImmA/IrrE family metallo-endopeptidase [Bradyrhizobium sp. SSUT77]MDH2347977.1 ImmA/IrrE family metallo-endopeptidase [Bradyrhizobium sp. SSUT77]